MKVQGDECLNSVRGWWMSEVMNVGVMNVGQSGGQGHYQYAKKEQIFLDFHFQKNCSLRLESWSAPNTELELRWGTDNFIDTFQTQNERQKRTDTCLVPLILSRHKMRDTNRQTPVWFHWYFPDTNGQTPVWFHWYFLDTNGQTPRQLTTPTVWPKLKT